MSTIILQKSSITDVEADVVVNAANNKLMAGGGVCGAIFKAAGYTELQKACDSIGYCDTGNAVITPGFRLCEYIIHAVGPIWIDGRHDEPNHLYNAYLRSLDLALSKNCHTIAFPLISSGIYGYPADKACKNRAERHKGRNKTSDQVSDPKQWETGNGQRLRLRGRAEGRHAQREGDDALRGSRMV